MAYYVIEHQIRTDGVVNVSENARSTFAGALSLYYDRCSKMAVNTEFPKVAVSLVDAELNVVEHNVIETQYSASETE